MQKTRVMAAQPRAGFCAWASPSDDDKIGLEGAGLFEGFQYGGEVSGGGSHAPVSGLNTGRSTYPGLESIIGCSPAPRGAERPPAGTA